MLHAIPVSQPKARPPPLSGPSPGARQTGIFAWPLFSLSDGKTMSDAMQSAFALTVPFLAQLTLDSDQAAAVNWLLGLACVAVAGNQIMQFWRHATGRFQPRQHDGPAYQTVMECKTAHKDMDAEIEKLGSSLRSALADIERNAERRATSLHQRIDPIAAELNGVSRRMDDHLADHRSQGRPPHAG